MRALDFTQVSELLDHQWRQSGLARLDFARERPLAPNLLTADGLELEDPDEEAALPPLGLITAAGSPAVPVGGGVGAEL
jgi:hypothetical protein